VEVRADLAEDRPDIHHSAAGRRRRTGIEPA